MVLDIVVVQLPLELLTKHMSIDLSVLVLVQYVKEVLLPLVQIHLPQLTQFIHHIQVHLFLQYQIMD